MASLPFSFGCLLGSGDVSMVNICEAEAALAVRVQEEEAAELEELLAAAVVVAVLATVANVANLCTSSFIFAEQRGPLLLPLSAASVSATDIDSTAAPPALPANVVGAAAAAAAAAATLGFGEVGGSGGCSNPASNNVNCTGRPIVLSGWC